MSEFPFSIGTMSKAEVDAAIAITREFGPLEMAREIIWLRAQVAQLQHDLDAAVGYKLAVAQETRGDHGYEK